MLYYDDLKDLRIYKRPFILPLNMKNKKIGSAALLLTPNYESTAQVLNNKLMIPKYYESYYIEKDVSLYISNESNSILSAQSIDEDTIILSERAKNTNIYYSGSNYDINAVYKIASAEYFKSIAIKYKVNIERDVNVVIHPLIKSIVPECTESCINVVSIVDSDDNIEGYNRYLKACMIKTILLNLNPDANIKLIEGVCYFETDYKFNSDSEAIGKLIKTLVDKQGLNKLIHIIKKNRWTDLVDSVLPTAEKDLKKLFKINETGTIDVPDAASIARRIKRRNRKNVYAHNAVKHSIEVQTGSTDNNSNNTTEESEEKITEATSIEGLQLVEDEQITEDFIKMDESMVLFEGDNQIIRNIIWSERIRTNKDILPMYDRVKEDVPYIKRTYFKYDRYMKKNIFIDFSYYNKTFFKNNIYKLDRAINLYSEFLNRLINDKRISEAGYNKKFVIIPVNDWDLNPSTKMWMYTEDINPISVFYRLLVKDLERVKSITKDIDFLFLTDKGYFKVNFKDFEKKNITKFLTLIKKLRVGDISDDVEDDKNSPKAITINTIEKIEKAKDIQINNLSALNKISTNIKADDEDIVDDDIEDEEEYDEEEKENNKEKDDLVKSIYNSAEKSLDVDDTLDDLDEDEYVKNIIMNLSSDEGNDSGFNDARNSRILKLEDDLLKKEIKGKSIKQMLEEGENNDPIPETSLDLDTPNEEFKKLTYTNMDSNYDIDEDIVAMLNSLAHKSMPISVRDIKIEDTSTSEDYIDTYTVSLEDYKGKRFSLVFDVPKFKDNKYMILRGNKKFISKQLFLMPVLKTDIDTAQIISNYKKIFIKRFGTTSGKSYVITSKIMKVIDKKDIKSIKVTNGDNSRICNKYELPIDYIDFAGVYSFIDIVSVTGQYKMYFNQDKIREDIKVDETKGIPVGIYTAADGTKSCIYYNAEISTTYSSFLHEILLKSKDSSDYLENFKKAAESVRYTYSKAKIMNSEIPIIIVAAYSEGLTKVMNKANIKFELSEKRPKIDPILQDTIRFSDGYLTYDLNYSSSLLMNGLKAADVSKYSLGDINSKIMYIELLDSFGGRLLGDGLDNFYDLMIDPITASVLKKYKLPEDYVSLLIYASNLLADNKYVKHTKTTVRRIRHKELIAACAYECLSSAYGTYRTSNKHGKEVPMTMKRTAIIDRVMQEPTFSDLSALNPLLEIESYNSVSTKGISGLNSDRSYNLDKRGYDDTMYGVIGMSTGFAGNVGITRQLSIDANIDGKRGYIKPGNKNDSMSVTKSFAMTEALTPYGTMHDDPFRTAMTFVQTAKHSLRTVNSDPLLITNGADEALPYMVSDIFAFKAKDKGTVVFKDDRSLIVEYSNGKKDYINLEEATEKNSSGGFFITIKLDTDLKIGSKFKKGEILAYDHSAFSDKIGAYDNIAYNIGKLTKIAILQTDEGYEDSTIISQKLSNDLSSEQVLCKDISLDKNTGVFNLLKVGDRVQEGEPIMIIQSSYDEDDANKLIKNLMDDNDMDITELGRRSIKAPITGYIQDIKIYRTCEIEDMSPSLQKIVKSYEKNIRDKKKVLESYGIKDNTNLNADYKLPNVGKLKNVIDGVLIEVYVKYLDKFSVGDKLINYSALKGVAKDIMPEGLEPTSEFNPEEKINILLAAQSVNGRMVCSVILNVALNKFLIELDRENKRTLGIPIDYDI